MRTIDATQGVRILDSRSTASLLSKVLWITTAGFLFTALGAYLAPALMGGIPYIGLFILTFGLIFAISFASRRSPGLALVLFYAFTILMGVEIGPLLKAYLHFPGGEVVVFEAALTTALGMFAMGVIAQIVHFDYRRLYNYAFAALLGLIVIGVIGMFVHFVSPGLYAWATLAIFSMLLLVDFMRLRDGAQGLSPVQMALSIYLDALNIFIALLQIFGSSSGNNGGGRSSSRWS
ncbi:MAG TPA: Bax inhibitor-1 family protein [Acidobacteriaceae bacterium]|jgi:modulator of FtsH protease|nr:Bax inhibitor-1 family protein [Acidobacteriaceae bacterium]